MRERQRKKELGKGRNRWDWMMQDVVETQGVDTVVFVSDVRVGRIDVLASIICVVMNALSGYFQSYCRYYCRCITFL
jgi:hypothetical protein